ncbi:putative hsp70-like protein [Diaporthe ampelina]|uniref:Putative hsp70-like protein n=1 Tax=Diaporthe ampelina TaxID=1214573 RepID=A0A0G2IGB2_9PEZI|nr:putative hsp70-like protein [Diaporthe ampelina]
MERNLNGLLKWSIEAQTAGDSNSNGNPSTTAITAADAPAGENATSTTASQPPSTNGLNADILASLLGGPSDADLMRQSMAVITATGDPEVTLEHRLTAFDNLEQLIESLDNANNLGPLGLWAPLLSSLSDAEPDVRRYAAWVAGTAVQNNETSQERLLAMGGLPRLVALALAPAEREDVRRKAVYALSSATRNYQPAMDAVAAELEKGGHRPAGLGKVDARNMDAVDEVMDGLKEQVKKDAAKASA